jgi:hypothetical protein
MTDKARREQHVGKATVEAQCRARGGGIDAERLERVTSYAAAADIRMVGRAQCDEGARADRRARFRHDLAVDGDLAGKNQRASALAGRRKPALDQHGIEARFTAQFQRPFCNPATLQSCNARFSV